MCRTFAADADIPWALAHGVAAFGPGFRASDGRLAVDAMVDRGVQKKGAGEETLYLFPQFLGRVPVDPHRSHTVASLVGAGLPASRAFDTRAGKMTLADLTRSMERDFAFEASDAFFRKEPWTLDALFQLHPEASPRFAGRSGEVDLTAVADAAVAHLKEQTRFLAEARAEGVALIPKRKQFIWGHPCGGLHLVEAAFAWGDQPGFRKRHLADAAEQVDLLFYRVDLESRVLAQALEDAPQYALNLQVQRLKFYGHLLETLMRLKKLGLWTSTPQRSKGLAKARQELTSAVAALKAEKVEDRMAELKTVAPQLYLDLIGDSCHAYTGLKESR